MYPRTTKILCSLFALFLLAPLASARQGTKAAPHKPAKTAKSSGRGLAAAVRLTDGKNIVTRTRADLGFTLSGKRRGRPLFTANRAALKTALAKVAPSFAQPATDPKPVAYRRRIIIKRGSDARNLDISRTTDRIARTLRRNPDATKFRVALKKSSPTVTAQKLRGINGVLSHFETMVSENDKRNHNIAVAISRIDGTLLAPGQTFSLNKKVGERTQKQGFLTAHVFQNSKVVAGIGGGVSQVTGTLFNAAALAGLKIVEVHPHSRPVAYLPLGRDATVTDKGGEDLKFTNNTSAPVYISYRLKGNLLQATLLGRRVPGRIITLRPQVQKLGAGKINAELYRVTKKGGKVSKERIFKHAYRWDPAADAKAKTASR